MRLACLLLTLLAAPVSAQDHGPDDPAHDGHSHNAPLPDPGALDYDAGVLDACLAEARGYGEKHQCIGIGAAACMEAGAGSSNAGISFCFAAEWEDWDARLNTAYGTLLDQQAELAADNAAFNARIPDAVESLRTMQRHWIAFRDAACKWEAVQWGGGTGAGPASGACLMGLTAQQTLFLEERVQ
ncbi:lysozyme inhibitor LprI family protein [Thalassorhabdomicrobium marinisediminis]|uniref:lysozyme inhibitor LprI family protein n=1 Tax=Thalassorhabdomicrobium marinisediminis TaxID=2170577 RepID=UPI002490582A|nr:lysozyme inhibitor LprI family protein [Thalassorhabdomicrobium marinisediminis]